MSDKDKPLQKGKALDISGVPLPGGQSFIQIDNPCVEPNRDEPMNAFREGEIDAEEYAHDYVRDEQKRLGSLMEGYVANKDDEQWSVGLQDEENEPDDNSSEGLFAEIQPLHIDPLSAAVAGEDDADISLRPDTVDDLVDDFTEDVEFTDETGDPS